MIRKALHLLLVLTLSLNGFSAPRAMAAMAHANHVDSGAHASADHAQTGARTQRMTHTGHGHEGHHHTPASRPTRDHAAVHHGKHAAEHTDAALSHADADSAAHSGHAGMSCCDGAFCQCGCVMPPAVSLVRIAPAVGDRADVAYLTPARLQVSSRHDPLLRPPAA